MGKLLFTHSYFLYLDPKQSQAGNAYPPLGTLYAASLLRENGFEVALFDSMLAKSPQELVVHLQKEQPKYLVIYDDGFNYLTKMCLTNMREAAFQMIELAKKQGCQVIISSSDSTDHSATYLNRWADFVVLGEGEKTLLELLQHLDQGLPVHEIQGIAFRENGATINKLKRPVQKDLDLLPFPAWDLVDIEKYKAFWKKRHGYFSLNLVTTRGCTYKCNWCAKPLFGNRYNARTPAHVVEELMLLVGTFGAEHIWFCDDIFGLKPKWIEEFSQLVTQKGLKFKFKIQSRADLMIDTTSVKALSVAGCDMVWIGAESGSQKILDAMEKGITIDEIHRSRQLLKTHGIQVGFFLQFGYPGEKEDDIQATLKLVLDVMPDDIGISVSYPLPGTKLYENVKAELKNKANWTDSDELAMMFSNSFPKNYYKDLQRYVHKVYRKKKSLQNLKTLIRRPLSMNKQQVRSALLSMYYVPSEVIGKRTLISTK
jgi:radical SAM superfamily enzyme YgiQ (UPF0313 family)